MSQIRPDHRKSTIKENRIPLKENHILLKENHIPLNENHIPLKENRILLKENRIPLKENRIPLKENRIPLKERVGKATAGSQKGRQRVAKATSAIAISPSLYSTLLLNPLGCAPRTAGGRGGNKRKNPRFWGPSNLKGSPKGRERVAKGSRVLQKVKKCGKSRGKSHLGFRV